MNNRSEKGNNDKTQVQTTVREFNDNSGRRVRETTTTTTTLSVEDGELSSTTKTEIRTQHVEHEGEDQIEISRLSNGVRNMEVSGKTREVEERFKQKFREDCLVRHNELRRRHGVSALKVNKRLEEKAQMWADHILREDVLKQDEDDKLGQNVAYKFASSGRLFTGTEIVDLWYDEVFDYDFSNPGFSQNTGHFTQVVWGSSEEIGIGVATDDDGTLFAVANYFPAGNYRGLFRENVKPVQVR